jgi:hypothetical protein
MYNVYIYKNNNYNNDNNICVPYVTGLLQTFIARNWDSNYKLVGETK